MLWLAVREALADQLDVEPIPGTYLTAHQPDVLHPAGQPVGNHGVAGVDDSRQTQPEPLDVVVPPTDTRVVGLALYCVQLAISLEPRSSAVPQEPFVRRRVGAGGQLLGGVNIQVVRKRLLTEAHRVPLEGRVAERHRLAGLTEGGATFITLWETAGFLVRPPFAQQLSTSQRLAQAGVVHLPCCIQTHVQRVFIRRGDP